MGHMLHYGSHTTLWVTHYTMGHMLHYGSHTTLWVTHYTMGHTLHYGSHTTLWVTHYTMGHTLHYGSHATLWVTHYTMGHMLGSKMSRERPYSAWGVVITKFAPNLTKNVSKLYLRAKSVKTCISCPTAVTSKHLVVDLLAVMMMSLL